MTKILGIDEAARGPVIGPMVVAGAMIIDGEQDSLGEVKDSKLLTPTKRAQLYKKVLEKSEHHILIISPKEIDSNLMSDSMNLNWLEAEKQAEIINKLNPNKAIIDCPSPNLKKYEEYLRKLLVNKNIELIVEHKADFKYPICSAASILAKQTREDEMEKIRKKYGDVGPGYPANPITKNFVKENWEKYPEIFRRTWTPWKYHQKMKNQKSLGEFN